MAEPLVGEQLIQLGWRQGSLIKTASVQGAPVFRSGRIRDEDLKLFPLGVVESSDYLIVISQDCDIVKPSASEPYVEVLPAFWTPDSNVVNNANRNSIRFFLLRLRIAESGGKEGLVVDAAIRLCFWKHVLLGLPHEPCFHESDPDAPRLFRAWLAARYNRPAVPGHIVAGVQKPIVDSIKRLKVSSHIRRMLDGIREMRYIACDDTTPYQIELLLMRDERPDAEHVSDEDASLLVAWIGDILETAGLAELTDWDIYDTASISVRDYVLATPLPLDQYTLTEPIRAK